MANVLGELFQNIADAIRSKTGSTDTLKPNQFPGAIEGITAGGGEGEKPFDCHSVTFVYGDKSYVRSVADGDTCADPVERGLIPTPTKESTAQYDYTFYGWGASDGGAADANILKNITADKTVYAIFAATARLYTITFYDDDGTTVLATKQFGYGTVPSYTPTKEGAAFGKWTPTPTAVTGDASYTASWKTVIASGTCGANAFWELDANYVLTISGTGWTNGFQKSSAGNSMTFYDRPWSAYYSNIVEVVVESGITAVRDGLFASLSALKRASIADGVTQLGGGLFYVCKALESVSLPPSVTSIGKLCFNGCDGLIDFSIPSGVVTIGEYAFRRGLSQIASITIPATMTTIEPNTFAEAWVQGVVFAETNGWWVSTNSSATSGTAIDVTNPYTNKTNLIDTYKTYYWKRT